MIQKTRFWIPAVVIAFANIAVLVLAVLLVRERPENVGLVAVSAALAGALGGVLGALVTAAATVWSRDIESKEQIRTRASSHALELTKMDYELRLKSLEQSGESRLFLAPAKVYRELYRAVVALHEKDEWPKAIEEMGLLNIFAFDPNARVRTDRARELLALLRDFLGKPRKNFDILMTQGLDTQRRLELLSSIREWEDQNKVRFPEEIQRSVTALANFAGVAASTDEGRSFVLSPQGIAMAMDAWACIEAYAKELARACEE